MRLSALRPAASIGSMGRAAVCLLLGLGLFGAGESLHAQLRPQQISGQVVKLEGLTLEVKPSGREPLSIKLADNFRLSVRSAADPAKLAPGAFVGTTAVAQPDGTYLAREVHVFPESMRGTGEGHRPMDTEPGSTMTNATITSVSGTDAPTASTVRNATLAEVSAAAQGRRLTLAYKGGEKVVVVPDEVPIVMVELADRALLVPGAHVVVYAATQRDDSLVADRVTVGKNGFVPPQ